MRNASAGHVAACFLIRVSENGTGEPWPVIAWEMNAWTWAPLPGAVQAGDAANAIPTRGLLRATLRTPDRDAWAAAPGLSTAGARETCVWCP